MGEGKITDQEQLKKKYLPLIVDQLKKGAFPQTLKPRLTKMGFAESEADDLINEAIALAAPAPGPKPEQAGLEADREKPFAAGFGAEEAEKMLKFRATTSLYGQPVASGPGATANLDYARFFPRFLAFTIDGLILSIPATIIMLCFMVLPSLGAISEDRGPGAVAIFLSLLGWVFIIGLYWFYFASMESGERQATYGKAIMGLAVVDESGTQISFARATGRHFAKLVSAMTLSVGFLMAIFTPKKQALHDYIAQTLVVKSR